ncbi:MAG: CZB domain-containing protein [Chitinivorax sp.]
MLTSNVAANVHQCELGTWLDRERASLPAAAVSALDAPHQALHQHLRLRQPASVNKGNRAAGADGRAFIAAGAGSDQVFRLPDRPVAERRRCNAAQALQAHLARSLQAGLYNMAGRSLPVLRQ